MKKYLVIDHREKPNSSSTGGAHQEERPDERMGVSMVSSNEPKSLKDIALGASISVFSLEI